MNVRNRVETIKQYKQFLLANRELLSSYGVEINEVLEDEFCPEEDDAEEIKALLA